jgi:hypothetical protein
MPIQSRPVGKTPPKVNELTIKNINLSIKGHGAVPISAISAMLLV